MRLKKKESLTAAQIFSKAFRESGRYLKENSNARKDPAFFVNECCSLITESGIAPFKLYDEQRRAIEEMHENRYSIVLKARQLGMTWLTACYALWKAIHNPYEEILIISENESKSKEVIARLRIVIDNFPEWFHWCGVDGKPTTQEFVFCNGSRIKSVPTTATAGQSFTLTMLMVDESATIDIHERGKMMLIWRHAQPALERRNGKVVLISTAKGTGNFFQRTWAGAEAGDNSFHPIFLSCFAVPDRDDAWYEGLLEEIDEDSRSQEYPRTAAEAFLSSGRCRMPVDVLMRWASEKREPIFVGTVNNWEDKKEAEFIENRHGQVRMFEGVEGKTRYSIGIDTAEGRKDEELTGTESRDWNVAKVFRTDTWEEVLSYRTQVDVDRFAGYVCTIAEHYNRAYVVPERNNHGHTFITTLNKRLGYKNIFREPPSRDEIKISKNMGHETTWVYGFLTTTKNRIQLLDGVRRAIREEDCRIYDAYTITEFLNFVENDKGKEEAASGYHDDCVMATALAIKGCMEYERREPSLIEKLESEQFQRDAAGTEGYGQVYRPRR